MSRVLVIEDEEVIRKQLSLLLERNNYLVTGVSNVEEALHHHPKTFDLILADIRLPGAAGTDIIEHSEQVPVIIMTSYASVRSAVESMKLGAVDYISKPFDHDELLLVIDRSLRENRMSAQNAAMRRDLARVYPHEDIATESDTMQATIDGLTSLQDHDRFVLLYGERGTGKELLARMSHECSVRSMGPLVFADLPIHPAEDLDGILFGDSNRTKATERASVKGSDVGRSGLVQSANGGTLVLHCTELLPVQLQRKFVELASATRSKQPSINTRVIALTATLPDASSANSTFIAEFVELFSRKYPVLPLRERREDIKNLAERYLRQFVNRYRKRRIGLSVEASNVLAAYQWPGNITELKSVIERAVLMVETDEIKPVHLGIGVIDGMAQPTPLDLSLDAYFRYFVLNFQGQLSETELAGKLGISRKALWERRQRMALPRSNS